MLILHKLLGDNICHLFNRQKLDFWPYMENTVSCLTQSQKEKFLARAKYHLPLLQNGKVPTVDYLKKDPEVINDAINFLLTERQEEIQTIIPKFSSTNQI